MFSRLGFLHQKRALVFLSSLGGRPCETGLQPLGTPFLRLASALLCTGINDPWCLLVKPV